MWLTPRNPAYEPTPGDDATSRGNGLLLCTDLDCAVKMHTKPIRHAFDPPVDEIIAARRESMRSRTIAFIRSVSDTERTTQHRT